MKSIILTFSCARDRENGSHTAIRETWGALCTSDHKFILGLGCRLPLMADEICVAAPDNYEGLPQKHRVALDWAKGAGYDYAFCSDIDTYVAFPRILSSDFFGHDFVGGRCAHSSHPSGGGGYWLSRKAFDPLIASSGVGHSWSDLWAFSVLDSAGIKLHHDDRYLSTGGDPIPTRENWDKGIVSVHLGRSDKQWNPDTMRRCHRSYLEAL